MNFSDWLITIMTENEISVEQLSKSSGVSKKDIRNWRRGLCVPKTLYFIFLLKALSKLTGCEEEILYDGASSAILLDS